MIFYMNLMYTQTRRLNLRHTLTQIRYFRL